MAAGVGADRRQLKVGSKSKAVQALRQRLVVSGDLDPVAGGGPIFDSFVEAAVKRFQARHGLSQTGVVNEGPSPNSTSRRRATAATPDQYRPAEGL